MKVSARNQFTGTISEVQAGAIYTEVSLQLKGSETIKAMITKESAEALGIKPGIQAIALVKAPQVIIVTDFGGYRISARNQLPGKIVKLIKGAINTEVDIELKGSEQVTATVTNDSAETLGLQIGQTVTAVFKSSAVILAVAA